MKKFRLFTLLAVAVLSMAAVAQKINLKINIPKEGNPVIVGQLPTEHFTATTLLVVGQDINNKTVPQNVEVKIKGSNNFFDKFVMNNGSSQRTYKSFPQDSVEITFTKEGYKTITKKLLVKLPAVIAARFDKE